MNSIREREVTHSHTRYLSCHTHTRCRTHCTKREKKKGVSKTTKREKRCLTHHTKKRKERMSLSHTVPVVATRIALHGAPRGTRALYVSATGVRYFR